MSNSMVDGTPEKRALTYIEERAGTEFEPEAAIAFVTLMRKAESGIQLSPMPDAAGNAVTAPPNGAADAAAQQGATTPVPLGKTPQGTT